MTVLTTIRQFVDEVTALNNISDAYDVFEHKCSPELRDAIYRQAIDSCCEPFRSAMHTLGFVTY